MEENARKVIDYLRQDQSIALINCAYAMLALVNGKKMKACGLVNKMALSETEKEVIVYWIGEAK